MRKKKWSPSLSRFDHVIEPEERETTERPYSRHEKKHGGREKCEEAGQAIRDWLKK